MNNNSGDDNTGTFTTSAYSAKQCSMFLVDSMIELTNRVSDVSGNYFILTSGNYGDADSEFEFWKDVKKELDLIYELPY